MVLKLTLSWAFLHMFCAPHPWVVSRTKVETSHARQYLNMWTYLSISLEHLGSAFNCRIGENVTSFICSKGAFWGSAVVQAHSCALVAMWTRQACILMGLASRRGERQYAWKQAYDIILESNKYHDEKEISFFSVGGPGIIHNKWQYITSMLWSHILFETTTLI